MSSSDANIADIRAAVNGADRAFQVIDGGKKGGGDEPPAQPEEKAPCPVSALGHLAGNYFFLDKVGQLRQLTASQVGKRHDLMGLFMGNDKWLRDEFPKKAQCKVKQEDGSEVTEEKVVDFRLNSAAAYLQAECAKAGLFGAHIMIRKPGVWPAENGLPVVHCGDKVMIGDRLVNAGTKTGNQVWAAAPSSPRPARPCSADVGKEFVQRVRDLWDFRVPGGEIAVIGLLACAYYGAAIPWRPAGFLLGGAGSGKSSLLGVLQAASPLHVYSNDTSKAGLEQTLDGRAMPAFIDEASDREDQRGARALLDLVLSASGGEGTKGVRGGKDGIARSIEVVGSIIMASIAPPDLKAQHLGRFTLIDLMKPEEGADHTAAHRELKEWARENGPSLWGRALAGWERYRAALEMFRKALLEYGCQPREMDQLGAIMAGWWVLTEDSVPDAKGAMTGVGALKEFVRDREDVITQDAPTRMITHLMSRLVMVQRSTERKSISDLISRVLDQDIDQSDATGLMPRSVAREVLSQYGIRVIRPDEPKSKKGLEAPREADGAGLWFSQSNSMIKEFFGDTPFAGDRWLYELRRLETARAPKRNVQIGSMKPARCIWVTATELGFGDLESA